MAEPYKSREFCKHINCKTQEQLDNCCNVDTKKIERLKNKCLNCMAYKFHKYLKEKNYAIVNFGKPFIEEDK